MVIGSALVLAEAVEDAAGGVGVVEGQGGPQHMLGHLIMHRTGRPAHMKEKSVLLGVITGACVPRSSPRLCTDWMPCTDERKKSLRC